MDSKCNHMYLHKWKSEKMLTRPCDQGGRDWVDAITSQGMLTSTRTGKGKDWILPLEPPDRALPYWHLSFGPGRLSLDFWPIDMWTKQMCFILNNQIYRNLLWQLQEINTKYKTCSGMFSYCRYSIINKDYTQWRQMPSHFPIKREISVTCLSSVFCYRKTESIQIWQFFFSEMRQKQDLGCMGPDLARLR